jgi:hypothetical protein
VESKRLLNSESEIETEVGEPFPKKGNGGWSETAKVLGLYAPEVKKIEMSMNQQRLQSKFESMSDADLVDIIEGRTPLTIEGEVVE